ncbi:hypothetical protein NFC81_07125 [Salinispirillum sp. LH 10-3-1]|uniref:Uncharacterized protein n=1 Tax=Salinispirillum sp. LH 10-3-1 TaxID=2952525 RepID=A0AB38YJB7_9GAMM
MQQTGNDRRIGDVLVENGLLTPEQLKKALSLQKAYGNNAKIGEIVVDQGWVSRQSLLRTMSLEFHIPMAKDVFSRRESFRAAKAPAKSKLAEAIHHPTSGPNADAKESFKDSPPVREKAFSYAVTSLRKLRWLSLEKDPEHELAELLDDCSSNNPPDADQFRKRTTALAPWTEKRDIAVLTSWYEIKNRQYSSAQNRLGQWPGDESAAQLWLDAGVMAEDYTEVVRTVKLYLERPKPPLNWYFILAYSLDELGMIGPAVAVYRYYTEHADEVSATGRYALQRLKTVAPS